MSRLQQVLGGSPLSVLLKLLVLSLLVGAVVAGLGLSPRLLLYRLADAFETVFGFGFDAVRNAGRYLLTGAMIVLPVWLVLRILAWRR